VIPKINHIQYLLLKYYKMLLTYTTVRKLVTRIHSWSCKTFLLIQKVMVDTKNKIKLIKNTHIIVKPIHLSFRS